MRGETSRLLRAVAANLAVYAPLVAGFSFARGEVLWPSVFLVGNLGIFDPKHMLPYLYWFVEAYAQVMVIVAALFSLPAVRRRVGANPFATGVAALVVTVAIKILAPKVWAVGAVQIFTVSDVFYLAVFGWCVFHAQRARQRLLVLGMAVAAFPFMACWGGNWTGSWGKFMLQLACVAMLLYAPRVTVPKQVAALALPVPAAGYHIYLFHRLVPELLLSQLKLPWPAMTTLSVATGILTGIAAFHAQKALTAWQARRRSGGAALGAHAAPAE